MFEMKKKYEDDDWLKEKEKGNIDRKEMKWNEIYWAIANITADIAATILRYNVFVVDYDSEKELKLCFSFPYDYYYEEYIDLFRCANTKIIYI